MNFNLLANFQNLQSSQWVLTASNPNIMLLNTITNDQFCLKRTQHNLNFSWDALRKRACYNIPNTPHVILATKKKGINYLEILVESPRYELQKLVQKNWCPNMLRQLIKKFVRTFQSLIKKYGFFSITQKMVRVTRNSNIILWINSDYLQTNPEFPLRYFVNHEAYKNAVFNVLSLFQDAGFKKNLQNLRTRVESEISINFEKFKLYLDSQLRCSYKQTKILKKKSFPPQFLLRRKSQISPSRVSRLKTLPDQWKVSQSVLGLTSRNQKEIELSPTKAQNFCPRKNSGSDSAKSSNQLNLRRNSFGTNVIDTSLMTTRRSISPDRNTCGRLSNSSKETGYWSSIESSGKTNKKYEERTKKNPQSAIEIQCSKYPVSIIQDYNEQILSPANFTGEGYHIKSGFQDFESEFHNFLTNDEEQNQAGHESPAFLELESELNSILSKN